MRLNPETPYPTDNKETVEETWRAKGEFMKHVEIGLKDLKGRDKRKRDRGLISRCGRPNVKVEKVGDVNV